MHERVNAACCEHVGLVGVEIDVCDCTRVRVEDEFYGFAGREREVPDDGFLVRRRNDPVGVRGVRRPLDISDRPGR